MRLLAAALVVVVSCVHGEQTGLDGKSAELKAANPVPATLTDDAPPLVWEKVELRDMDKDSVLRPM